MSRCVAVAALVIGLAAPASAWQQATTSLQKLLGHAMHLETGVGDIVSLTLLRAGQEITIDVTTIAQPQ